MTKNEEEIYKEIKEAPSVQEEELRKAWKSGQISITPEKMEKLLNAVDEHYSEWFNERLKQYNKDSGDDIEVSWEEAKRYITLRDLKEITDFTEFVKFIKGIREQETQEKKEEQKRRPVYRPTKYSQPVTKVTENLPRLDFTGDTTEKDFRVSAKSSKKRKDKVSLVSLMTDNTALTSLGITYFDNVVLSAVVSFIEAGESTFTLEQITNLIYYGDNTESKAGKSQQEKVRKSLNKQMALLVDIDYTEHLQLNGVPIKELGGKGRIKDQRLPLKEFKMTNRNGNIVICYSLKENDLPPEYIYAKDVKQIATVDARLLDTPQDLHLREKDLVWRDYFIRNIDTMKKDKKYSHTMLIETILTKCNISLTTRDERSKLLKRFEILLSDFQRKGFIKGYKVRRGKKKVIDAYEIEL